MPLSAAVAVPHPTRLRRATFSPGEGMGSCRSSALGGRLGEMVACAARLPVAQAWIACVILACDCR